MIQICRELKRHSWVCTQWLTHCTMFLSLSPSHRHNHTHTREQMGLGHNEQKTLWPVLGVKCWLTLYYNDNGLKLTTLTHFITVSRGGSSLSLVSVLLLSRLYNIFWSVQPGRTQVMKVRFLLSRCGQIANVKKLKRREWLSNSSFKEEHNFHLIPSQLHTTFSVLSRFTVFTCFVFPNRIDWNVSGCSATRRVNSFRANKGEKKNINSCTCNKESLRKADRNTAR